MGDRVCVLLQRDDQGGAQSVALTPLAIRGLWSQLEAGLTVGTMRAGLVMYGDTVLRDRAPQREAGGVAQSSGLDCGVPGDGESCQLSPVTMISRRMASSPDYGVPERRGGLNGSSSPLFGLRIMKAVAAVV
jgi:hypothetical protein